MAPTTKRKRPEPTATNDRLLRQTTLQFKASPRNSDVTPDMHLDSSATETTSASKPPEAPNPTDLPPKRGRGRPRKNPSPTALSPSPSSSPSPPPPPPPPPSPTSEPLYSNPNPITSPKPTLPETPRHSNLIAVSTSTSTSSPILRTDRNINLVTLGPISFPSWYPSPYSHEVLGLPPQRADLRPAGVTRKRKPPAIERLFVCPMCFKYGREALVWLKHVKYCGEKGKLPGRMVYEHPAREDGKGKEKGKGKGKWEVWEVDGEQEGLFCQNLSLFGKLFLDTKSIFFDVAGFKFFLLVYTQADSGPALPPPTPSPTDPSSISIDPSSPSIPPETPRILGFFSKEKMSWDNNNLACILIFPPWQRQGLGSLLMGVSYEIARREKIMGGPEKPISDLGLKGYRRFWGGEIARWLLGVGDGEGDNDRVEDDREGPVVVSIEECSKATWITPDDCLATLREMQVAQVAKGTLQGTGRARISKEAVRRWVTENGISLRRACDPEGFIEGYAIKEEVEEETETEEEEEEEDEA